FTWILLAGLVLVILFSWREVWHLFTSLTTRKWYAPLQALKPRSLFEHTLACILAIQMVFACTQVLTLPMFPRGWDLYSYHWAIPQVFLFHHAVYTVPGWAAADFPINAEMLSVLALAFGTPIAASMIQMVFGFMTVLLIAGFLYRHAGSSAAWLGVLLCMTSPLFIGYLNSGYVEPAEAFYGVASLIVILLWVDPQQQAGATHDWQLPLLAGLFAGLGIGVKYQEGMTVVGIVVLLTGIAAFRMLAARLRRAERKQVLRRFLCGMILYLGGIVIPLLPWLFKDWVSLGNPIYPFIWGGPGWDDVRSQIGAEQIMHFGPVGSLGERLIGAFFQFFHDNGQADDQPFLPLNPLLLLAPFLVLLELLRSWTPWPRWGVNKRSKLFQEIAWAVVIVGAYSVWVVSHTTEDRYAMSWMMLLVVPTTILVGRIFRVCVNHRMVLHALQALVIALLLLGPLYSLSFWRVSDPLSLLAGQVSLRQWEQQHLSLSSGYWEMVAYINRQLPPQARILLLGIGWGYFLQGHDYVDDTDDDWVPYLVKEGKTPSGFVALLQQQGFQYLTYQEQNMEFTAHGYGAYSIDTYLPTFHHFLASSLNLVRVFADYSLYSIPGT
ncbi:MAG TPA: hypothetical protein VH593_24170, partial [Ktedonobacteraceae bacterium]